MKLTKKSDRKLNNNGASLLAVIVIVTFVTAIAVLITSITVTNIMMREVEQSGKSNFYSTDSNLEELASGIELSANRALEKAYETTMINYAAKTQDGVDVQEFFAKLYLDALEEEFINGSSFPEIETDPSGVSQIVRKRGYYSVSKLKNGILVTSHKDNLLTVDAATTGTDPALVSDNKTPYYILDYKKNTFTFKNIIVATTQRDYQSTIHTDLVLSVPNLNLKPSAQIDNFMKFSMIADDSVNVIGRTEVQGNVYAGADTASIGHMTTNPGIYTSGNGEGTFAGKLIITRGDITSGGNGKLNIGGGASNIWAENIKTTGSVGPNYTDTLDAHGNLIAATDNFYNITLNGNIFVADDLTVGASKTRVKLAGSYYGYNFQKNYDTVESMAKSNYSSAIMINSKDGKVDLTGLNYLMLAGRSYISRKTDNRYDKDHPESNPSDIALGESISARSNQLAYYVCNDSDFSQYLRDSGASGPDGSTYYEFSPDGVQAYQTLTGVDHISSYLVQKNEVVPYYYRDSSNALHRNFYLNFKNEQLANDFFNMYMQAGSQKRAELVGHAENYIYKNALILNNKMLYSLRGDLLYRTGMKDSPGGLDIKKITIGSDWSNTGSSNFKLSADLALQYKSAQLTLSTNAGVGDYANVRIEKEDPAGSGKWKEDKTIDTLFEDTKKDADGKVINHTLIDRQKLMMLFSALDATGEKTEHFSFSDDPTDTYFVYTTDNHLTGTACDTPRGKGVVIANGTVRVMSGFRGIVVSTGDVEVHSSDFKGLIICDGTITLNSNTKLEDDPALVGALFEKDTTLDASGNVLNRFAPLFVTYSGNNGSKGSGITTINLSDYIEYENWTKH